MELRSLGESGLKVSVLSMGAMTFGQSDGFMKGVTSSDDEGRRVFDLAIERGINLVDTANVYGNGESERVTGQWVKGKRDRVLIATKCRFPVGTGKPGPHDMGLSRKHVVEACEASLQRLGVDTIDLYQTHMQDCTVPVEETMRALDDLQRAGKIRYAGCSNYTGYRLVESLWASDKRNLGRYESVQLQWSLLARGAEREMLPACKQFGLGTMIWSPLAGGFLSGKYTRNAPPPAGSRLATWVDTWKTRDQKRSWDIVDKLAVMAKEKDASPAAVALAWLLAKPITSTIIVGARTTAQLEDNLKGLDVKLEADDVAALDAASKPDWDYPYDMIGRSQEW